MKRDKAVGWTLTLLLLMLADGTATAQNPLLGALEQAASEAAEATAPSDEGAAPPTDDDPQLEIETRLEKARSQLAALEQARDNTESTEGEPAPPTASIELAARLVRVLEQRREAQIQTAALEIGRNAIESGLSRNPREIVADPPPFPVPTLDGVLAAWRNAAAQEEKFRSVLEDRRANVETARERAEDLAKERRRLRDVLANEKDDLERLRHEADLRSLEGRLAIAREQVLLAEQRVAIATIEHDIQLSSTRQAQEALTWVETQLVPRSEDLSSEIEKLDLDRINQERALDLARARVDDAEAALRAAEARTERIDEANLKFHNLEVASRREQLTHRQQAVSLLSERIERLGRIRTTWQHRYAVLGDALDLKDAPAWRDESNEELDRLARLRRIHEAEMAETERTRQSLKTRLNTIDSDHRDLARLVRAELQDLEELIALFESELLLLDSAISLEERLRVELTTRMKSRDLGERFRSAWAAITSFWSYELTTSEDSPITPGKILIALTVFVAGLWAARFVRAQSRRRLFPRFGFDAGASSAFASLTFYALLAATFLMALRAVNIPLTAFAVAGGALAIGVGFGSQTVISNFISGLLLLAERPIRTGDLVEVSGVIGTVESIGLRSTRIRTPDNFHIIVPNASFLESNVVNWTHEDPVLRLRVKVGVAYGSDTRRVKELLEQAATEHDRCRSNPAPLAVFSDFGDSALLFEVRFWIRYDERTDRSMIQSDVRYRIDELFAENDIVIAFPQMDVHLDVATQIEPKGD